jgi:hypothetical protein
MTARPVAASQHPTWPFRLLLIVAAAALAYVVRIVAQHTISIVEADRLLPRWDLATHLGHGWQDYHLLATGQIHRLLWDLWLQGYWPPVLSIYQVPFYLVLGGGMSSGLWSGLVAFVLVGLVGSALLWRQWEYDALLPASVFLALLMSSPYLLAYASVTMTETVGALAQLVVLFSYLHYRRDPSPRTARLFAVALTMLFFTKYNYFFLIAVPLALHEWLERTAEWNTARRVSEPWRWTLRMVSSPTGVFVGLYVVGLLLIVRTGGFEFQFLGRRISVHTIGNSGHVVLYVLLARLWYLHRHGRIDWAPLMSSDPLMRALLLWFAAPVTIWLASPYPNHLRDFANLVINRPLGEPTVEAGLATYLDALRTSYFYSQWLLAFVVVAFGVAMVRYRRQPPLMQWLILAVPLQFAVIALHQTRFPRFLLLTVVLLCLAASSEVGRWFAGSGRRRVMAGLLAPMILAAGVVAARNVVTQQRFQAAAFENYTRNDTLRAAVDSIRADLEPNDRLAIVGQGNEVSPALFRWELGPPSGLPCFPFEIGGARGSDLALATRVLLMAPLGPGVAPLDVTSFYLAQRRAVLERADRGDLVLRREIPVADMHLGFWLYARASRPDREAACQ